MVIKPDVWKVFTLLTTNADTRFCFRAANLVFKLKRRPLHAYRLTFHHNQDEISPLFSSGSVL